MDCRVVDINAYYQKWATKQLEAGWKTAADELRMMREPLEGLLYELGNVASDPEALNQAFDHRVRDLILSWIKLQPAVAAIMAAPDSSGPDDQRLKAFLFPEVPKVE
jgi:hypothetical protein